MNQKDRLEKIERIVNRTDKEDLLSQEIMWEGNLKTFKVYNIPLEYLIYNKYNGRILSRTKSLERQNYLINVEDEKGKALIEKLLWDSKEDRNRKTLNSLKKFGQQKVGIITRDGVIIDGNRRAMLLNKLDRTSYFKAIVLEVTIEEEPTQIEKLETTYQMGEDEKLGYNSTEKYLKAKQIYERLIENHSEEDSKSQIADWMSEPLSEIENYLETMTVMDEYLEYLDYDGIYTQLDGREDQFLSLRKWLKSFYGGSSRRGFDNYTDNDVDQLKYLAFDYLRFKDKFDGKEFRYIGEGNSDRHFFGSKEIWTSFLNRHSEIIRSLPEEPYLDVDSKDLDSHLNARNNLFYEQSKLNNDESEFIENLNNHKDRIGYNKASNEPEKLVNKALQTFEAVKTNHTSFSTPEVQDLVIKLSDKVFESLINKSNKSILTHIVSLLNKISLDDIEEEEVQAIKENFKEIQKICYKFDKAL